jgi:hypothetical protein
LKKFEITLLLFSGAWGKMIHEKKPEAKNFVTISLSEYSGKTRTEHSKDGISDDKTERVQKI